MPEIQTLTQAVRDFSRCVDLWNKLMLVGLALTVLAGVFVLVATRMVVFRTGQMATAQESLAAAKDRQLALDLADKDVKIADAKERTAKLLAQIQPRELTVDQQRAIGNALRPFASTEVTVTVWSYDWDMEGYELSKQIASALKSANLRVEDHSGIFRSPLGVSQRGVIISWWLTESLAKKIGDALEHVGQIKGVAVTEARTSVANRDGSTSPSTTPVLSVFVAAKPFDIHPTANNK